MSIFWGRSERREKASQPLECGMPIFFPFRSFPSFTRLLLSAFCTSRIRHVTYDDVIAVVVACVACTALPAHYHHPFFYLSINKPR